MPKAEKEIEFTNNSEGYERGMKRYQIIEIPCSWACLQAPPYCVKEFRFRLSARLYRWLFYSFSDPAWQGSFRWEIRTVNVLIKENK